MSKRLIVAPHADDEALGCGGLLAKYAHESTVLVLADKNDGRLDEHEMARKVLGYRESIYAGFATGALTDESRAVTGWLDQQINRLRPEILYLPSPDAHQDHVAGYESGIRAARLSYTASTWFVPTVLLYEVPSYVTQTRTIPYPWSRFELLTPEHIEQKIAAIAQYASQSNGTFSPCDMAAAHARYLGARCGDGYAEQYAVVRDIHQ